MGALVGLALANFTLTFFILGIAAAAVALFFKRRALSGEVVIESLLAWFVLFNIGVSYFYNFVMHVFFADMAARFIGWANSPFQYEVGFASLGFALVGFWAFRGGMERRVAAILGPAAFLWGAAGGHVYQMIEAHNYAPGNAGVIFWTDIFLPLAGFALLIGRRRAARSPVLARAEAARPL